MKIRKISGNDTNEYIKKSEAVDVIVKYPYEIAGKTATAIKMIEDLPSADVIEVVRCKDCKYFVCADDRFEQHCSLYGAAVAEDEFCSAG